MVSRMISVAIEDSFVKKIDNYVKKSGMYSSRSEFLKDSMRKNLVEMSNTEKKMKEFAKESIRRGFKGMPTREKRAKIALEIIKEDGFNTDQVKKQLSNQKQD